MASESRAMLPEKSLEWRRARRFVLVAHQYWWDGRGRRRIIRRRKIRCVIVGWGNLQGWLFRLYVRGWGVYFEEIGR